MVLGTKMMCKITPAAGAVRKKILLIVTEPAIVISDDFPTLHMTFINLDGNLNSIILLQIKSETNNLVDFVADHTWHILTSQLNRIKSPQKAFKDTIIAG
jgi:hypothetical protein